MVTLQAGQSLDDLAQKYQTTRSQILLDNPAVVITSGATLTIREKTVQGTHEVAESIIQGNSAHLELAGLWAPSVRITAGEGRISSWY